jgi:arginine utilization protein RocB
VEAIADRLVAWQEKTGTSGEVAFGERLRMLLEISHFRSRPDDVVLGLQLINHLARRGLG